jgi:hypothetical protein
MTETPTAVMMDEAGNTGENLLDPDQPIFALAAVHVSKDRAQAVVDAGLGRTQLAELKFAALRRSSRGRRNVVALLEEAALMPEIASTGAAHKPWMLAGKLIDELVEPTMLARGVQLAWYGSGAALGMVQVLYSRGFAALGEQYDEMARAFVPLVRDYTPEAAQEFLTALGRSRIVCRDPMVSEILDLMVDTEAGLVEEFAGREDALDPSIPLLFDQGCHWSERLGTPFEFIHDDSNTIERWKDRFVMAERAADPTAPLQPVRRDFGGIEVMLPTGLQRVTFEQSDRDARLQLADVLAGATAHLVGALSGARRPDQFARDLYRLGLTNLLVRWIGPDFEPVDVAAVR